jgi:hypothetical protein|tara:strand:+ start:216 stop:461 length:246 start_codon:yes stop_codon:yes gene_type:complete
VQRVRELAIEELIKRGYSAKDIDGLLNPEPVMPEIMSQIPEIIPEMISITEVSEQLPTRPTGLSAINNIVGPGQSSIRELD